MVLPELLLMVVVVVVVVLIKMVTVVLLMKMHVNETYLLSNKHILSF
jgi:hypothetical protein